MYKWFYTRKSVSLNQDLQVEISAFIISQYRFLWLNLSEMLQALGNAYARTYSTYCLFMLVETVFICFSEIVNVFSLPLLRWWLLLFYFCINMSAYFFFSPCMGFWAKEKIHVNNFHWNGVVCRIEERRVVCNARRESVNKTLSLAGWRKMKDSKKHGKEKQPSKQATGQHTDWNKSSYVHMHVVFYAEHNLNWIESTRAKEREKRVRTACYAHQAMCNGAFL